MGMLEDDLDAAVAEHNKQMHGMDDILRAVREEVWTATRNWPPFNSAHEGYGVLAEEFEELWAHVRVNQKKRNLDAMRKEAIQVAAMAVRFAAEICDEQRGRK